MINVAITTVDNPYDPFEQYELWRQYDEDQMHYYSNQLLDRVISISSDTPDEVVDELTSNAIDDIMDMERACGLDNLVSVGIHMKARRKDRKKEEKMNLQAEKEENSEEIVENSTKESLK